MLKPKYTIIEILLSILITITIASILGLTTTEVIIAVLLIFLITELKSLYTNIKIDKHTKIPILIKETKWEDNH